MLETMKKNPPVSPEQTRAVQEVKPISAELSVVVPVIETHDDVFDIVREFVPVIEQITPAFEMIFVFDGRSELVYQAFKKEFAEDGRIRSVLISRLVGEATALMVGFEKARGEEVYTLPPYVQVEPSEFVRVHETLKSGYDVVATRRYPRKDSIINRFQSAVFHWIVSKVTGTELRDISCGVRGMKRRVADEIHLYGDLHQFFPVLAETQGFRVVEQRVAQDRRDCKVRLNGIGLYFRRLLDILNLFFLLKFTRKPLRFFGLIGGILLGIGAIIGGYLTVWKLLGNAIGDRSYVLLLAVFLIVIGMQTIFLGLIGEIITYTNARDMREYRIDSLIE